MYQNKRKTVLHSFAHGQQESIVTNLGLPHHPLPPPYHMNYIHSMHAILLQSLSIKDQREEEGYKDNVDNILSTRKD
jgi:hypothetical protein